MSDLGAHQFASPNRRISAGTSKPLTSVASRMIANATPKPIIFTRVTPLVTKEAKTIATVLQCDALGTSFGLVRCQVPAGMGTGLPGAELKYAVGSAADSGLSLANGLESANSKGLYMPGQGY